MGEHSNTFIKKEKYKDFPIIITVKMDTSFNNRRLHKVISEIVGYSTFVQEEVEDAVLEAAAAQGLIDCKKFIDSKEIVDGLTSTLRKNGFSWTD